MLKLILDKIKKEGHIRSFSFSSKFKKSNIPYGDQDPSSPFHTETLHNEFFKARKESA